MTLVSKRAARDAESQSLYNPEFTLNAEDNNTAMRSVGISQTLDWSGKRKYMAFSTDSIVARLQSKMNSLDHNT